MFRMQLKIDLLNFIRKKQIETINNLQMVMEESQKAANDYGAPRDRYDSFRTQLLRKRDMYAKQLQMAMDQLSLLDRISLEIPNNQVEFGALVFTNKQNLFVSIGLGKIEFQDSVFYAISPNVPIFQAIESKRVGDEVPFNGSNIKILDVF